jgi:hypothetical protein
MPYADPQSSRRLSSSTTLALLIATSALVSSFVTPASPGAEAAEVRPITLPIHRDRIADVHWTDTFGAPRGGGRSHIGVDMLGPKMVPLVAARSGTVTWGRLDNSRGSILRIRDDQGWEYQYIHLNNDTPGTDDGQAQCTDTFSARLCTYIDGNGDFADGVRVSEGEIVAFLGDGGNAEWTASHLHFEVYKPVPGGGTQAINPTPSVDAARARALGGGGGVESGPPVAAPGDAGFVDHVWFRLHGRSPTSAEREAFAAEVAASGIWPALAEEIDAESTASVIDRLYLAFFLRYPDSDGIRYWIGVRASGYAVEEIAEWFAESNEYQTRYEGTSFSQFLDQLYADVLDRPPDQSGKAYWLDLLERGVVTRGTIVVYFTESTEMKLISVHRNEIVALSLVKNGTAPTDAEVEAWEAMRASQSTVDALTDWYQS